MKRYSPKYYEGKVGWCDKDTLGLSLGHYVFIRKIKKNGLCDVNTLTSIEDNDGYFNISKIKKIKNGVIYPIPKSDDTLRKFGGVDKRVIKNVPINKIQNLGFNSIKKRHHYYIKKYLK